VFAARPVVLATRDDRRAHDVVSAMRGAILVTLLCAPVAFAKDARPTKVTLTFGWQPGWEADATLVSTATSGDREVSRASRTAHIAVREGDDDTLEVAWTAHDLPLAFGELSPAERALLTPAALASLSGRIGHDGAWRGHLDDAAFEAAIGAVEAARAATSDPPGRAALFARETLDPAGRSTWDQLVGGWVGQSLRVGRTKTWETEEHFLVGAPVPAVHTMVAEGWVPCHDGPSAPTCVVLRHDRTDDPGAYLAMLRLGVPEASDARVRRPPSRARHTSRPSG
jgi:hypothetical protein